MVQLCLFMKYCKLSIWSVSNPNMFFSLMLFSVHTTGVGNVSSTYSRFMFVYRLSQAETKFPGKTQLHQRPLFSFGFSLSIL